MSEPMSGKAIAFNFAIMLSAVISLDERIVAAEAIHNWLIQGSNGKHSLRVKALQASMALPNARSVTQILSDAERLVDWV